MFKPRQKFFLHKYSWMAIRQKFFLHKYSWMAIRQSSFFTSICNVMMLVFGEWGGIFPIKVSYTVDWTLVKLLPCLTGVFWTASDMIKRGRREFEKTRWFNFTYIRNVFCASILLTITESLLAYICKCKRSICFSWLGIFGCKRICGSTCILLGNGNSELGTLMLPHW